MFSKDKALKIAIITLSIIAGVDLIRAFMHTFNIWWASENIAPHILLLIPGAYLLGMISNQMRCIKRN